MSLFSLYGIKEVADVTFWTTGADSRPVLYLDTLKVSTIEETGEQAEARGGKGNAPLIIWDYGKEITLTLEDALFSMKSMQVMQGAKKIGMSNTTINRTRKAIFVGAGENTSTAPDWMDDAWWAKATKIKAYPEVEDETVSAEQLPAVVEITKEAIASVPAGSYVVAWEETAADVQRIEISSDTFPGTYKITGDTYARNQETGEDEFFQFIIPLAKVNPEQTITMQADGDPSTFSMTVRVLRPASGAMMELVKYN